MRDFLLKRNWLLLVLFQFYFFLVNFSLECNFNYKIFAIVNIPIIIMYIILNNNKKDKTSFYLLLFIIFFLIPFQFFEFIKVPFFLIKNNLNNNFFLTIIALFTIGIPIYLLYNFEILIQKIILIILISIPLLSIWEVNRIYNENQKSTPKHECFQNKYNFIFIIFDEYTSPKILKNEFDFNFETKKYNDKGFYISKNSNSKFASTFFSLNHLFSLGQDSTDLSNINFSRVLSRLQKNFFFENFNYNKYDIKLNSFISYYEQNTNEEYLKNAENYSCVSSSLLYTYLTLKEHKTYLNINKNEYRKKILEDVEKRKTKSNLYLNELLKLFSINNKGSKHFFQHYHFTIPHAPYIFNKKITNTSIEQLMLINKKGYIDNIVYTNQYLYKILDSFSNSNLKKNTILVIQGDHGYRGKDIDKKYHKNILNIIHIPNKDYFFINDTISNVNTIKNILNYLYYNKKNIN